MTFLDLNTKILVKPDYINGKLILSNNINNINANVTTRLYQICPAYMDLRNHIDDNFLFMPLNGDIHDVYETFIDIADYINWILKDIFIQISEINLGKSRKRRKNNDIAITEHDAYLIAKQMKMPISTFISMIEYQYKYIVIGLNTNISLYDNIYGFNSSNAPDVLKSIINIEFDNKKHYDILGSMLEEYGFNKIGQNYYFAELNLSKFDNSYYSRIKELSNEKMQNFLEKKNDNKHIIPEDCDDFRDRVFKNIPCE